MAIPQSLIAHPARHTGDGNNIAQLIFVLDRYRLLSHCLNKGISFANAVPTAQVGVDRAEWRMDGQGKSMKSIL